MAGESSLSGAVREVKEELGIDLKPAAGRGISQICREETGFRPVHILSGSYKYLAVGTCILCAALSAIFIFQIAAFLLNPSYRVSISKQMEEKTHSGKVLFRLYSLPAFLPQPFPSYGRSPYPALYQRQTP